MENYYWYGRQKTRRTTCVLSICILMISSCRNKPCRTISKGFYYWKTNMHISNYEQSVLDSLQTRYLYVRFFDVDISPGKKSVKPLAIINFPEGFQIATPIIPVVFITPRALNAMSPASLDFYAQKISILLANKAGSIHLRPKEIQIDCDWNSHNKDLYFALLGKLKARPFFQDKTISATIRLHQIKYPRMNGIPPVDKGLLMVYNTDQITDIHVDNSIISLKTAKQYLSSVNHYPIPLDIALPIYSWTLLFDRHNGNLAGILRNVGISDLQKQSLFKKQKGNRFLILKDTTYRGYPLKSGDIIRHEQADFRTVHSVAQYLSSQLNTDKLRVSLYSCDSLNFRNFPAYEMEKIFNDFN